MIVRVLDAPQEVRAALAHWWSCATDRAEAGMPDDVWSAWVKPGPLWRALEEATWDGSFISWSLMRKQIETVNAMRRLT